MKCSVQNHSGFTLIELMVVAAMLGILLAIALPNLIKARISANEANARKAMQTLRDSEGEYFSADMDGDGNLNYTDSIGDLSTPGTLRCPSDGCTEQDALVDGSFEEANSTSGSADCVNPKAGYCFRFDPVVEPDSNGKFDDFGWQSSASMINKTGRKDFSVYADGVIRCTRSSSSVGTPGTFEAARSALGCP